MNFQPISSNNQQQQQHQQTLNQNSQVPQGAVPQHQAQVFSPVHSESQNRQLNVKDALTYLDQVKIQFSDRPEVYNRFLDIMKDFKSQK